MTEPIKIRRIRPSFKMAIPESADAKRERIRKETKNWRNSTEFRVVTRHRADHPAPTPQPSPCVLWQGRVDRYGYGVYSHHDKTRSTKVHRYIWELFLGRRLAPSEVVMHKCDNRACYSLLHTEIGTIALNNADARRKGRASKPPVNRYPGEKHPMAMLNRAQVDAIHVMLATGASYAEVARAFNITRNHAYKIGVGIHWKDAYDAHHPKEASDG